MVKKPLALYIHWPFCLSKCPYCDFNSHVAGKIDHNQWLNAYLSELDYFSDIISNSQITSIFFGGGTPSLMNPEIVSGILNKIKPGNIEITLEANPTSIEINKFKLFHEAGINRVSIGVQALDNESLKFLGRTHDSVHATRAIEIASSIFSRYSFDLIYARPNQTLKQWEAELLQAIKLAGDHMSLYQLTIEKGTPFYNQYKKNVFTIPDSDQAHDLYELTGAITKDAGFNSYEISNYAKLGGESVHNMAYWRYDNYLGIGPGAHSRINGSAIMMVHNPDKWLAKVAEERVGIQSQTELTDIEILTEILLMGLRINEGIKVSKFEEFFGAKPEFLLPNLGDLIEGKFIEYNDNVVRATSSGKLLLNQVISKLTEKIMI